MIGESAAQAAIGSGWPRADHFPPHPGAEFCNQRDQARLLNGYQGSILREKPVT